MWRRLTVTVTVQKKSTLAEQTETDLAGYAMTCKQFRKKTDQKAKHGDTAVEHFGSNHPLGLDLRLGSILVPGIARLVGRARHEKLPNEEILQDVKLGLTICWNFGQFGRTGYQSIEGLSC